MQIFPWIKPKTIGWVIREDKSNQIRGRWEPDQRTLEPEHLSTHTHLIEHVGWRDDRRQLSTQDDETIAATWARRTTRRSPYPCGSRQKTWIVVVTSHQKSQGRAKNNERCAKKQKNEPHNSLFGKTDRLFMGRGPASWKHGWSPACGRWMGVDGLIFVTAAIRRW